MPGTTAVPAPTTPRPDDPQQAFEALKAGNERYVTGAPLHPNQSVELRKSFADSQDPFIAVLACADARVILEIIFDQGISDIFDVQVAGNTVHRWCSTAPASTRSRRGRGRFV